jgi:hypothetical protein
MKWTGLLDPGSLRLMWDPYNLTMNRDAKVSISLWGYKESHIKPELLYIDMLEDNEPNDGEVMLVPRDYFDRYSNMGCQVFKRGIQKIHRK